VIGVERIAVMAALNLSNEVLTGQQQRSDIDQDALESLHSRIDEALL